MLPRVFRIAGSLAVAAGSAFASPAVAETWPSRPVTIMVPFVPGGTTDIVARSFAQELGRALGQTVLIENRGGAGGTLAAGIAAKAPADGYLLFMATVAHAMAPGLYKRLAYDFQRDFDPVTVVASVPNVLIVNPGVPAHSAAELIAYLKSHPDAVNYGSAGPGSTEHLSGELFRALAGVKIAHVPYKGGSPMMTDLIAGQIQMAIETSASAAPQVKAGKVRALAVTSGSPSPAFPGVPALREILPGYEVTTWYGLMVPHGTPAAVIDRLYRDSVRALKSPELLKRFEEFGASPGGDTPAQFAAFIQAETAKWTRVAKESGASVE